MTNAQIAAAVAAVLAAQGGNGKAAPARRKVKGQKREKLTDEQKAINAKANAELAEKMFAEAGFKDCQAHVTIKTYGKWEEIGRRVKKGEKALRTPRGMALFHFDQTEVIAGQPN